MTMDKKTSDCLDESKGIERRIRQIRKQKKSFLIRAEQEQDMTVRKKYQEQAEQMGREEGLARAAH